MSWAFSDESERADRVLFGLTLVPAGVVKDARRTLRVRKDLRVWYV